MGRAQGRGGGPEDYDRWLDAEVEDACSLAAPFPSQLMKVAWEGGETGIMSPELSEGAVFAFSPIFWYLRRMADAVGGARRRGRPVVGAVPVNVRLTPAEITALDQWIRAQASKPTRPEAIRRLIRDKLV